MKKFQESTYVKDDVKKKTELYRIKLSWWNEKPPTTSEVVKSEIMEEQEGIN